LPQRANPTKPRNTLIADGVSRVMVSGWGHPTTRSRQTRVRLGRGAIIYPNGQPFESSKQRENGTSLYVGLKRMTKLIAMDHAKFWHTLKF
jgi:hypothetical protein